MYRGAWQGAAAERTFGCSGKVRHTTADQPTRAARAIAHCTSWAPSIASCVRGKHSQACWTYAQDADTLLAVRPVVSSRQRLGMIVDELDQVADLVEVGDERYEVFARHLAVAQAVCDLLVERHAPSFVVLLEATRVNRGAACAVRDAVDRAQLLEGARFAVRLEQHAPQPVAL